MIIVIWVMIMVVDCSDHFRMSMNKFIDRFDQTRNFYEPILGFLWHISYGELPKACCKNSSL